MDDLSDDEIIRSLRYGDMLMDTLELPADIDHSTVIFSMFTYAIHALVAMGWTKEALIKEIHTHEALETTTGMIQ